MNHFTIYKLYLDKELEEEEKQGRKEGEDRESKEAAF